MKKVAAVALLGVVVLTGCAMGMAPVTGFVYSDVSGPLTATGATSGFAKVGQSEAVSYLGLVGLGDASIDAAAKAAGISKIHHVDYHTMSIIGLYACTTVTVYGE
ncbi:MAG TPA: TRL-like family protein [bacterium]|nr:TRL-like family protein [bacterium]HPQ66496.1 TRL-like family protein [bacterium]